ncbi:transcription factor [Vulcanisaeta thermophila]|uniref:transcription factor n=1 Tax=Vulcanisaeta thermophila TaxID=867917 RepID=UPI0008533F10|nr:transcription factor [Vulcanisaeta thermophila]
MSSEEERREEGEEEIERGGARSELRGNILRIRWVTGKTSAARLFGRYGREGRPDFFRLLFGAIAGSLREQFPGDKANELFNTIKNSSGFKDSMDEVFESMKRWFFDEVIPKYKLERGDVFTIITNLELNIDTGELKWDKDTSQVIYWVRSDRVEEKCREMGIGGASADVENLRRENEELRRRNQELEDRVNNLLRENERLKEENEELRRKLENIKALLGSTSA